MKKIIPFIAISIFLSACSSKNQISEPIHKSNLTAGQVSLTLRKNITTQAEVVEAFGAPNVVSNSSDGTEIWTYQKNATVTNSSSSSSFATIIFAGIGKNKTGFEQSSRTMTLIIKFKEINGVKTVVDFSSRYSSF